MALVGINMAILLLSSPFPTEVFPVWSIPILCLHVRIVHFTNDFPSQIKLDGNFILRSYRF